MKRWLQIHASQSFTGSCDQVKNNRLNLVLINDAGNWNYPEEVTSDHRSGHVVEWWWMCLIGENSQVPHVPSQLIQMKRGLVTKQKVRTDTGHTPRYLHMRYFNLHDSLLIEHHPVVEPSNGVEIMGSCLFRKVLVQPASHQDDHELFNDIACSRRRLKLFLLAFLILEGIYNT